MSVVATTLPAAVDVSPRPVAGRLAVALRHVGVMCWRNLVHIAREPMQLSDVTVQPVLFTLLFVYVFGSGIPVSGGSYTDFVLAGLLVMNLVTSSAGTSVGLSTDLTTGMLSRFRALPMWRTSVLVGRTLADLLSAALCALIVAITGLAVGWRPDSSVGSVVAGFGIVLLFAYALCWPMACLGLISKGPESAMSVGFVLIFPLAFVSNALVPTTHMPAWLRATADWNPVSAVTAAARHLFGNPNPTVGGGWPVQHPVEASLLWSAVILVVAVPLAVRLFRRRTVE